MLFDWQPAGYPYYSLNPGTYYWQASHIDTCSGPFEPPKVCEPYSPVWEFVVTAIPPPESVSPAEGVAVSAGTTVEFVVHSAVPRDPYIVVTMTDGNGHMLPLNNWDYSSPDGSLLYFHWVAGYMLVPGTIAWTPYRLDCKASPGSCEVLGTTHYLTVTPVAPVTRHQPASNGTPSLPASHGYCSGPRERLGTINHRVVCLHPGGSCSWRHRSQYRRYDYQCVKRGRKYRLIRH
jgi:hypothetical protein